MTRALLGGVAALLAGCMVFEVEPALRVELPGGDLTRAGAVDVRVRSAAPGALALRLDGAVVARGLADGDVLAVDVSTLGDGLHRLTVESDSGTRTYRSGATVLRIDRTPPQLVATDPAPGAQTSAFQASATFDEPVAIDGAWLRLGAVEVAAEAAPSADGRRVTVAVPPLSVALASARLAVHDAAGNPAVVTYGAWSPGALDARFDWAPVLAASWVVAQVVWRGTPTPHVFFDEVDLGVPEVQWETPEAELGGALAFDTRPFADGPHRLSLRAEGYLGEERTLVVDNTPPRVVYCGPRDSPPQEARVGAELVAVFDEEVFRADAPTYSYTEHPLEPGERRPAPWIWEGTTPPVRDLAGNLLMETPCPVTFPIWRTPAWRSPGVRYQADGAADVRLVAVSETEVELLLRSAGDPAPILSVRAFVPDSLPSSSWRSATVDRGLAYEVVGAGAHLAWSAPRWGGWELRNLRGSMLYVQPLHGPVTVVAAAEASVAWLEGAGSLRELHRIWPIAPGATYLDLSLAPSASLEGLALDPRAHRVALVERRPDGVALLYERGSSDTFPVPPGPREGPLNADPAASASEPALLSTPDVELLAWVEAGRVRLRSGAPGGAYGEPLVANADATRAARSPALSASAAGPVLTFVEAYPGGDRLEVRRLVDGAWRPLPSIELGTSGRRVDVAWPGVLWRGALGDVQVRAYNE